MNQLEQIENTIHHLASPKRSHTFWGMVLVLLVTATLLWLKHGEWLQSPNDNYLAISPDGFKNYLTTAWHVRYDSTFVHYGGMNYPYGEHTLFTDNQPIFSSALQWWSRNISYIGDKTVGIVNISQIISILIGCAFLFLLLRKLHLPVWYAGIVTVGMTFLAPQYHRFDGHFGLSHTFVFTALLYLLCRYEERKNRRYQSLLIGVLVWFAAQLHFYYLGFSLLFLSLYIGFQILRDFRWANIKSRLSHWFVMLILPFALLNLWVHWSDYMPDRPATPYGFTSYIGYWEGIFLPYKEFPMHQWINEKITRIREVDGESKAYTGVVVFFFTLGLILWGLYRRVRNLVLLRPFKLGYLFSGFKLFPEEWDEHAYHRVHKQYLRGIFTAAFLLLLFSCGFPFAIKGMEWMTNYFGPIRQFRGLGRFTWGYYYVANILAFYIIWNHSHYFPKDWKRWFFGIATVVALFFIWNYLHHAPRRWEQWVFFVLEIGAVNGLLWYLSRRFKWFDSPEGRGISIMKKTILLVPLFALCYEGWYFQKIKPLLLSENTQIRSLLAKDPKHWLNTIDFSKYQALLPLPYYHMGSENIWLDIDFGLFIRTQLTAFHTGVPDMGVNMSRTSVGQTVKSAQLTLEPGENPAILGDLHDNRPLALMIVPDKWENIQKQYAHLVKKARPLFESDQIRIMELSVDSLKSYIQERKTSIKKELDERQLYPSGAWRSTKPAKDYIYESYDSLSQTPFIFRGKGAYQGVMSDTTWLWKDKLPKEMHFMTLWLKATEDMGMNHEVKIIETSRTDGHQISFKHEGLRFYLKQIVGEWAMFELAFEVKEENSRVNIFLQKNDVDNTFYLDEVMIKPASTEVYRKDQGYFSRNNFWYKE